MEDASALLGRYYSLTGTIVKGTRMGRKLGFPTANLSVANADKLIPGTGVYVAWVQIGNEKHKGLVSIGNRPTFEENGLLSVEAYIIDFNADIYGEEIQLEFVRRLRGDMKFDSADELISRMKTDLSDAVNYFEHNKY
ncbi:MAG TPA: riboflavin kinase, partial [Bacteroidia bacterium]|nr:riboflavin kinase [Bacteroidia bacterium]